MSRATTLSTLRHRSELCNGIPTADRRGAALRKIVLALGLSSAAVVGGWVYFGSSFGSNVGDAPLVGNVVVGRFVHEIVERGDVQSSANVEVRSAVQLRGSGAGVAILELVPEGTFVEEGDFLVRLDDSSLQNDAQLQEIDCNASQANVVQAQTAVETAKLALSEYESGKFKQEEEQLQSEIFVAKENYRRAEEYLRYSERLSAKGYVTPIQLEADRFAVDKSLKELEVAETKLAVLRDFTKQKMIKQLDADVKTALAKLEAAREIHSVELSRLTRIKEQIANCLIKAPKSGQVVYANQPGYGNDDGVVIEEGRLVRERQVIIRLPNPKQMQVTAKVNESRIDMVRPGMAAKIKIDALADMELEGIVRHVSEYPTQQNSVFTAHIKEYATEIEIVNPPKGLRPGMTAQAAVVVEQREHATQVPLQSVMERDGRFYCLVEGPGGIEARQVQVGPTNDKFVVIEAGLQGAEQVVMTPKQFSDRVALPAPIDYPARKPMMLAARPEAKKSKSKKDAAAEPVDETYPPLANMELMKRPAKRDAGRPKTTVDQEPAHGGGL